MFRGGLVDDENIYIRRAIEEARRSRHEAGSRVNPWVGAVVVKEGRMLASAHRGEFNFGDHAEYTVLEKKLSEDHLAECTVYTTLEPCIVRNPPKLPCADHLIERKVKRVVIGMLDPDQRITGKGILKLRKAGIIVDLFPVSFMSELEELNRNFTRAKESQLMPFSVEEERLGIIRVSDFEFFPTRENMVRFRNFHETLRNLTTVKLILVGGSKLIEDQTAVTNVAKVLLPKPTSSSLAAYAATVYDSSELSGLAGKIKDTTNYLLARGVKVKWYPHMINHAVVIADPDKEGGWAQWESLLPYEPLSQRRCFIAHKPRYASLVRSIDAVFEKMFDSSEDPQL